DGELATVAGASAAKAPIVLSSRSSVPLRDLIAKAETPVWYQLFASEPNAKALAQEAVSAGCRALCVTIGVAPAADGTFSAVANAKVNWATVDTIARDAKAPVLVKGITTLDAARTAVTHGAGGVIVSNYRGTPAANTDAALAAMPAIVDAVGARVPV